MSESAKWYVVHTYSGYEKKVAEDIESAVKNRKLEELICDVKLPIQEVPEDNKKRETERNPYSGYVFVKMVMTDDTWYVVRNIRGVTGFVGPGSKPVPLTDDEVLALNVEQKKQIEVKFSVGDSVKVTAGPMEGFIGVVETIDLDTEKVTVLVSMFGRETPVELELGQVGTLY